VLDRLTPAERTSFVLHDVFGLQFDAIGEIVGRTPTACRQLASRARRSIRDGEGAPPRADVEPGAPALLAERFISACDGGDLGELMALLDPDVAGDATLLGYGPIVHSEGRPEIARRILDLFGPASESTLVPFAVEGDTGFLAFVRGRFRAVVRMEERGGVVRLIRAFVLPPR
jgi:RNA polymerase sigma-70 factor, ECF subfamily